MAPRLDELVRGLAELTRQEGPADGLPEAVLAIGRRSAPATVAVLWRRVGSDLVEEAAIGSPSAAASRWARAVAQDAAACSFDDAQLVWHLAPIHSGRRAWGVIALGCDPRETADSESLVDGLDIALLLAGWFAGVLDRHQADRRIRAVLGDLERTKDTDPLTHVLHRRAIEQLLGETTSTHATLGISLPTLDAIGQTHGETIVEAVLSQTAIALKRGIRPDDHVGRVRRDRFVVLLDGADTEAAQAVAGRLWSELQGTTLPLPSGAVLTWPIEVEVAEEPDPALPLGPSPSTPPASRQATAT